MLGRSGVLNMPHSSLTLHLAWVYAGLGRHYQVLGPDYLTNFLKYLFIGEIIYTCQICAVKYSVLAFYYRIFKHSTIRLPIYILTAVITMWGVAIVSHSYHLCALLTASSYADIPRY